jgi:hypothetical protein
MAVQLVLTNPSLPGNPEVIPHVSDKDSFRGRKVQEVNSCAPSFEMKIKEAVLSIRTQKRPLGAVHIQGGRGGGPEANQELFVFQKIDGTWKIARYCFSTTNPPRA